MASRAFTENTGPSTHHHVEDSMIDSRDDGSHSHSHTLSAIEANNLAADWQNYAESLNHDLKEERHYRQGLENELKDTQSRLEFALQQRPYFNNQRQRIVPQGFVTRAQEQKEEIKRLKKEINEMTDKYDSVVSHWQDALQELEETKSSKTSLTVDDDAMTSKWKQLQFVIKNLSTSFLHGLATSSINAVTDKDLGRYRRLMPMADIFPIENEYIYLCQILIWDFITVRILSVPTIVWGRDVYDSTEKLFAIIRSCPDRDRVSASDFHAFRAHTGEIIKTATDVDLTVCNSLKDELKVQLRPFTPPDNAKEVSRQLDNIIDKAVDLAIIFTQSRCYYYIKSNMDRGREHLFDPRIMDNIGDEDGLHVHSIISPILFKYGNSKGENYDERIILAKAAVLC
ncbi:hypothetical protein F4680DRAFT_470149 [Xylaria scruposa]|nr:hypothetical protein F4680DRAFT_470149 [Xylaria scruposa]